MPETDGAQEMPPSPPEMRALMLNSFGGLKSMKLMTKPKPTAAEGEVVVRVKACGMNFQDLMVRQGAMISCPKTPFVMGLECAGEIEEVGEGVTNFKVGDHVIALPEYRAWADFVNLPASLVYPVPEDMSYSDAVSLAINYVVAYSLLFDVAHIKKGDSVLIHSVGGGVGTALTQLARIVDDIKVFGVASKVKHEKLTDIDHLMERGQDYVAEVRKINPEGVNIVLDCLYGEDCNKGLSLLKPMGTYILFGTANMITGETKSLFSAARSWWQVDKLSPIKFYDENKTISGFNLRQLLYVENRTEYVGSIIEKLVQFWKDGKIKPIIDSTWAMDDIPDAMQKMHDRVNVGKIIIDMDMEAKPKPSTPSKAKKNNEKDEKAKKTEENGKETKTELEECKSDSKEEENSS